MRAVARGGWGVALLGLPALALLAGCGTEPAGELSAPRTLASSGAGNPTVAVDPGSETAWIAWVATREGRSDVMLSRWEVGGAPAEPVRVNHIPGDAAPHLQAPPRVAAAGDGLVHVLWQNNTPVEGRTYPASDLRFARSTDGGRTFEPAYTVNDDPPGTPPASHTFHDMALGPGGEIVVSWIDSRERYGGEASGGTEASGGAGEIGPDIRVAVSRDRGRSFGPSTVVDRNACPCCRTDLAVGSDGAVWVAWRKVFPGSVRDVVVARSTDGGATFGPPVAVHDDGWVFGGCPHAGPAVTVGPDGVLHVAWYTGREGGAGLYHARSGDGGTTFSLAEPLVTGGWVPPSQVDLVVTGGRLWAGWEDRMGAEPGFLVATTEAGRPLEPGVARRFSGSHPQIGSSGTRHVVAWLEGEAVRAVDASPAGG